MKLIKYPMTHQIQSLPTQASEINSKNSQSTLYQQNQITQVDTFINQIPINSFIKYSNDPQAIYSLFENQHNSIHPISNINSNNQQINSPILDTQSQQIDHCKQILQVIDNSKWDGDMKLILQQADQIIFQEQNKLLVKKQAFQSIKFNQQSEFQPKQYNVTLPQLFQIEKHRSFSPKQNNTEKTIKSPYDIHKQKGIKRIQNKDLFIKIHFMIKLYQKANETQIDEQRKMIILEQIWSLMESSDHEYKEFFNFSLNEFQHYIYNDEENIIDILNELGEIKLFEKGQKLTYKHIVKLISSVVLKWKDNIVKNLETIQNESISKDKMIHECKQKIVILKQSRQQMQDDCQKQMAINIKQTETKVNEKTKEIERLQHIISDLKEQMHKFAEKSSQEKQLLINSNEIMIKESNIKIYELKQILQDNEFKYDQLKSEYDRVKSVFEKSFISLKLSKDQIEELKLSMYEKDKKISSLEVRASYNYDELTPRPNFEKIEQFLQTKIEKGTTQARLDQVFEKMKQQGKSISDEKRIEEEDIEQFRPKAKTMNMLKMQSGLGLLQKQRNMVRDKSTELSEISMRTGSRMEITKQPELKKTKFQIESKQTIMFDS